MKRTMFPKPLRLPARRALALTLLAALLATGCATQQQRAERREYTRKAVAEMLERRHWRINISSMNTMRYGSRIVTSDFYLELRGDTLCSYLPYLGQAYQAPLGSPPEGLNFEVPIKELKTKHPKADKTEMDIDVKTREDAYHYYIEVYDTGKASISVHSQNHDPISFDGDCDIP